jgi:hypothetical protein
MVSLSWNLIWSLGKRSMREKLSKHFKHHFQCLRENKIKNHKFKSKISKAQQDPRGYNNQGLWWTFKWARIQGLWSLVQNWS